jgi:hypothetical protein
MRSNPAFIAIFAAAAAAGLGISGPLPQVLVHGANAQPGWVVDASIPEDLRTSIEAIAKEIIAASPPADPADVAARDAAADRLASCQRLLGATEDQVLWGGYNPKQGYDPESYRFFATEFQDGDPTVLRYQLTAMNPAVWARLYLSTFMFPGRFSIRSEGRHTVLELEAAFRSQLDAGEYPYPFWHSPNKWTAYVNSQKVALVFDGPRLVASLRIAPPEGAVPLVKKAWDGHWTWTDSQGKEQPRVALFSYMFSRDNPHVTALDSAYRSLAESFRAHTCMDCHAPNNLAHMNDLLLLNYPNQALISRRSLLHVLNKNAMPPGNREAQETPGIHDPAERDRLIELTKAFLEAADTAYGYERSHGTRHADPASGGAPSR